MKIHHQFFVSVILALALVVVLADIFYSEKPELENGDLVFQTGGNLQALAVMTATGGKFTRIGIVKKSAAGDVVVSLNDNYAEMPFEKFVGRGVLNRYAIYRYRRLDPERAARITMIAEKLGSYGESPFFNFEGERLYPSEAAYLAYRDAGLEIGSVQKIRELNMGNLMFKNMINVNWQDYPVCQGTPVLDKAQTPDECRQIIEMQDVVTPVSLARDVNFELVYSNYPF